MSSTTIRCSATELAESTAWRPDSSWLKNGSTPMVRAGRAITSPTASALAPPRARAALCGRQFISSATRRIRALVASLTPGRPLSAKDTAPLETPAWRAMSAIVGLATEPDSSLDIQV